MHEKWFQNGQGLEVVNSYVYLGYMLTTKLSVSTALEPIMVKAKKKVMDSLRALWKIKCTDISIFLRLFDHQVQPALTYAAEVWGAKKIKEIEKVMHTRKPYLLVRKHQIQ